MKPEGSGLRCFHCFVDRFYKGGFFIVVAANRAEAATMIGDSLGESESEVSPYEIVEVDLTRPSLVTGIGNLNM